MGDEATTTADLVERLRANDVQALESLMLTYQNPLYAYACRLVPSEDLAADVVQDVFVRLWEGRATFRIELSIRAYLFRAVRNAALNVSVSEAARVRREHAVAIQPVSSVETPADVLEQQEFDRAVREAIEALPPRSREIFTLVRNGNLTYPEVASILGISVSTVKTQMGRAMVTLSSRLLPFFLASVALCGRLGWPIRPPV